MQMLGFQSSDDISPPSQRNEELPEADDGTRYLNMLSPRI